MRTEWQVTRTQSSSLSTHHSIMVERYEAVLEKMAQAAQRAGRSVDDVTLIAVTKTWPVEVIETAYEVGMRHFGENRAEELVEKRPYFSQHLNTHDNITWHFIGTLQSRKSKLIAEHADTFHALDRLKIANRLAQQCGEFNRTLPCFLEVNLSGEMSKSGIAAAAWENSATQQTELRTVVQQVSKLPNLSLVGLMTMAPWDVEEDIIRSVFRRTRQLAEWMQSELPEIAQPLQLSMGMTDDFAIAIEEGATHIRVGRALFGDRY